MKQMLFFLLSAALVITGCHKDDDSKPKGKLVDYGYVSTGSFSGPARMIHYKGEIFVGTDNGVWKIKISEKQWSQVALSGKKVSSIYSHPSLDGIFYAGIVSTKPAEKSLYISNDAGQTWQVAESPVFDDFNNTYETYYDLRARPGHPGQLFANLSGATIAISKDSGNTWHRQNYAPDSYFGDFCIINFLENKPNEIYQGAEAPLDHAWLGKYAIDAMDPVKLGELDQFIGRNYEWSNRRPNSIETFPGAPGVLYVGMEGALSKVEGSTWKYLFEAGETADSLPYAYIKGIWLDPSNNKHLVFGGGINGLNTSLSLFETYDEGKTIVQIKDKLGMQDPEIIDIVATNSYPAVLVRERGNMDKLRLFMYRY